MRRWDKHYPHALGAVAALAWWCAASALPETYDAILATSVSIGAILLGFLGTIQSVLIALRGERVIRELRVSGHFDTIVGYIVYAVHSALLFCGISAFLLWLDVDGPIDSRWERLATGAWVGVAVAAAAGFFRVLQISTSILRFVGAASHDDPA